jgi:hypothetical protein
MIYIIRAKFLNKNIIENNMFVHEKHRNIISKYKRQFLPKSHFIEFEDGNPGKQNNLLCQILCLSCFIVKLMKLS